MRVLALHHRGPLEEIFRRDGEELRLVGQGVPVDVGSPFLDLSHLSAHQIDPRTHGQTVEPDTRYPVDDAIGLVDEMGEFMHADVAFVCRISESLDQIGF